LQEFKEIKHKKATTVVLNKSFLIIIFSSLVGLLLPV